MHGSIARFVRGEDFEWFSSRPTATEMAQSPESIILVEAKTKRGQPKAQPHVRLHVQEPKLSNV
jgi:hypothetical protein